MADPVNDPKVIMNAFAEMGVSGLEYSGGIIDEEKLLQLRGPRAVKIYREMSENDDVVGAIVFAIEMLMRSVDYYVKPASQSPEDLEYADFLKECQDDMSHPWDHFIAEVVTMLPFGWEANEIVYKLRLGPDQRDPSKRSKYDDGLIGWRKLPTRSQESLDHWEIDEKGSIKGLWQLPPNQGGIVFIPIEKLLLFRTTCKKNNPEGRSILRTAYKSWFHKKEIERIEAIGIERNLAGLPYIKVPAEIMDPNASADKKAIFEMCKKIGRNVRNDEQGLIVFPSDRDDKGNLLYEFSLLTTGNTQKTMDTNTVINRYAKGIALSVLADVILLGHENVGSFALADSKTNLFATAINSFLNEISSVMNRFAIPRLFEVNNFTPEKLPELCHGDLEKQDMQIFANAVAALVQAGGIHVGGEEDEKYLRKIVGMPEQVEMPGVTQPAGQPVNPLIDPVTGRPVVPAPTQRPVPVPYQAPANEE